MNKILAVVIVFALVTTWFVFGQGTPQKAVPSKSPSAEKELINLEEQCSEANVKADVAFLDRILADDYMDTDWVGAVTPKAQFIAALKSGNLKVTSSVNDDYKVRVYGKAAVVTIRFALKGQFKDNDISGQYRETDTWVKHSGHWQIVATHESRIAENK